MVEPVAGVRPRDAGGEPTVVIGPLLRWVDDRAATVWVEADRRCTVEVLGSRAPTFEVAGHHYGLVVVDLTGRGHVTPYEVRLDGHLAWPPPADDWPAPIIRRPSGDRVRIVFGSCRAAAPDTEPWTLPRAEHPDGLGIDALEEFARELVDTDHVDWPDLLLMLGDQVYADAASPETRAFARSRRDTDQPPGDDVADFEEYTRLYRESWTDPEVRWLLSTVPTAMVFDDHDVIDDWNISASWVDEMRSTSWWHDRIVGALVAYWVHQHLGNLSPSALEQDPQLSSVRSADGDVAPFLWRFAEEADRHPDRIRWSFHRRIGDTDVVVLDARAARVLHGRRDMLDPAEWAWLEGCLAVPARHVLVATTLPVLLPIAIHDVEVWNERICAGAWGSSAARAGEVVRRAIDLEHWAAFGHSFGRLVGLLHDVAVDPGVDTVALLSGDVHHGQVDRATWPDEDAVLWQVVASPMRQEVTAGTVRAFRFARSKAGRAVGRMLRRAAGGAPPPVDWQAIDGPLHTNHVAVLDLAGADVDVTFLTAGRNAGLKPAIRRRLR